LLLLELVYLIFRILKPLLQIFCPCLLPVSLFDFLSQFVVVVLAVFSFALIILLHFFGFVLQLLLKLLDLLELVLEHAVFSLHQLRQVIAFNF
jgi:hypothetical protein